MSKTNLSNRNRQVITLFLITALAVSFSPILFPNLIPGSSATSTQTLYPNIRTTTSCGYGFSATLPSEDIQVYNPPGGSFSFCMTANDTLTLSNSTLDIDFDCPCVQSVNVSVILSDQGSVIAESGSVPTTVEASDCAAHSFTLYPVNGGQMKSGDLLNLTISVVGILNYNIVPICTGSGFMGESVLNLVGSPTVSAIKLTAEECKSLLTLPYEKLSPGSKVTNIYPAPVTYTVPNVAEWYWYYVPTNGQNPNSTALQIINEMWSSGHGQNFNFFVGTFSGRIGVILITDYWISHECSS